MKSAVSLNPSLAELKCLYALTLLAENRETPMQQLLNEAARIIPGAWPAGTAAGCRITFDSLTDAAFFGQETPCRRSGDFYVNDTKRGTIEIFLTEESETGNDSSILLTEIAERLGRLIKQKETRDKFAELNEELLQTNEQMEYVLSQANTMAIEAEIANIELGQIFNTSADAMWVIRSDYHVQRANKKLQELTGQSEKELTGKLCHEIFSHSMCQGDECPLQRIKQGAKLVEYDFEHQFNQDEALSCILTATPLRGLDQELIGIVADFKDISARKKAEAALQQANMELQRLASIDSLTKIANRRRFDDVLTLEWRRLQREKLPLALIMIDIDCFKIYNDTYGHQQGDDCLQSVARSISQQSKRPADLVARYGGEEFVVVLPNTDTEGATQLAEQMRKQVQLLNMPHKNSPVTPVVTISLGVSAVVPVSNYSPEQLLSWADQCLYQAKEAGRNRVQTAPFANTTPPADN
ncbi:MAG: diguanylate cyclase [Pseudomonadota bacterium]|nr:diguanylate cyclase [Pseudomonadota bacterium]